MNVLMLSIDRGLLGKGQLGDVVERHIEYGKRVERLDIIVMSKKGYDINKISDNVTAYPTNSNGTIGFILDAIKIGKKFKGIDLIVCQDPIVGLAGYFIKKKTGAKLLINLHGDYVGNKLSKDRRYNSWWGSLISKFVLNRADAIRVMSQGMMDRLIKMGFDSNKIKVISTPVDIERFIRYPDVKQENKKQIESLASSKMQKGKKHILMVGRKDKVKDFDTLCRAINLVHDKYKNVGLWLVGNYHFGPEGVGTLPLKQEIKDSIVVSFNEKSKDLPAYYYSSYLTVLSSTSESFGKVLVEANACGKPVVATETTGAKEIVQDGYNGFLVPIGDAEALAEKIFELLNDPKKAKKMGEDGRKLVKEKFSNNTQKIITYWKEIVA